MREKIKKALQKVRPSLQFEGGDVELIDVDEKEGIVKVRLTGACGGCPMSHMTMTYGIEQSIRQEVPEVKKVVAV